MTSTALFAGERESRTRVQAGWQQVILLTVIGYEAAGALVGGPMLMIAPDGSLMKIPVVLLHGAFRDFFIPGIILTLLGVLNAWAFVSVLRKSSIDWFMAGLALGGFVIWFVVEIVILQELHWLHLMWGVPVLAGWVVLIPLIALRNPTVGMQNGLLLCGLIVALWYTLINAIVPMFYEGYSVITYTVSELSAIDAPTRLPWVLLALPYPLLFAAFGWGILRSTRANWRLRLVGGLVIAYGVLNLYWPPMHQRGIEPTLTDTLHIAWAMATVLFMMTMMGFGSMIFGKAFRYYTIISMILLLTFGLLTSTEAPNIPTNGPTPWIGLWERINIGIFLLWTASFSIVLVRRQPGHN